MSRVVFVLTCTMLFSFGASNILAAPVAEFGPRDVIIRGMTPRAAVVVIAAIAEPQREVYTRLTRFEQRVVDTDGDGQVVIGYGRPIPPRSIWAIVDESSGSYAVATPNEYPRREADCPQEIIRRTAETEYDQLQQDHVVLQTLWVRPGRGAWVITTADGGFGDEDGRGNGRNITSFRSFRPLGHTDPAPRKVRKDDVLVFIDPFEMSYGVAVVTQ